MNLALVMSGLALAIAVMSAFYTRSQAVSTGRLVELEHGVRFELQKRNAAQIAVPGRLGSSDSPKNFYVLTNVGRGTAFHVRARTPDGHESESETVGPGLEVRGTKYSKPVQVSVTWQTSDGRGKKQRVCPPS